MCGHFLCTSLSTFRKLKVRGEKKNVSELLQARCPGGGRKPSEVEPEGWGRALFSLGEFEILDTNEKDSEILQARLGR